MARAITTKNLLTSSPALYSFVNAATESLTTSRGLGSVQRIAGLAFSLRHTRAASVTAITVPIAGDPADRANVILAAGAQEVFDALAEDTPLPPSATGEPDADDAGEPDADDAGPLPPSSTPSGSRAGTPAGTRTDDAGPLPSSSVTLSLPPGTGIGAGKGTVPSGGARRPASVP
jgi:hypothetical protein